MLFLKLLTLTLLLIIFAEDMYSRAVHWFLFPLLIAAFVLLRSVGQEPLHSIMVDAVLNSGFVLLQYSLVTLYFSVKRRRLVNITSGLLGWGDILFIFSFAFVLSPVNYVVFYIISLIVVLIGWLIYTLLTRLSDRHIPLAGMQAFLLAVILTVSWWRGGFGLAHDTWILHYLAR
jgi:hypothetical protein